MSSNLQILTTPSFDKSIRRLLKKYPPLSSDLVELKKMLLDNPYSGIALGKDCYKIRMKISSKNTGKSGGARVITYVKIQMLRITLLDIYDKGGKENISDTELTALLKKAEE